MLGGSLALDRALFSVDRQLRTSAMHRRLSATQASPHGDGVAGDLSVALPSSGTAAVAALLAASLVGGEKLLGSCPLEASSLPLAPDEIAADTHTLSMYVHDSQVRKSPLP